LRPVAFAYRMLGSVAEGEDLWFESLESVTRFVGEDSAAVHVPPEARAVLSSYECPRRTSRSSKAALGFLMVNGTTHS
jgi:hypothetical protein